MLQKFLQKISGFLVEPVPTFQVAKDDRLVTAAVYSLVLLVVNALVTFTLFEVMVNRQYYLFSPLSGGIVYVLLFVCATAFMGLVLHGAVFVAGGRGGIVKTFLSLFYGLTPLLVTSWALLLFSSFGPFGNWGSLLMELYLITIFFWTIYVVGVGLQQLHPISPIRSYVAVGVSLIFCLVVMIFTAIITFILSWGIGIPQT